jgi:flagellar hook-length control protein FliK
MLAVALDIIALPPTPERTAAPSGIGDPTSFEALLNSGEDKALPQETPPSMAMPQPQTPVPTGPALVMLQSDGSSMSVPQVTASTGEDIAPTALAPVAAGSGAPPAPTLASNTTDPALVAAQRAQASSLQSQNTSSQNAGSAAITPNPAAQVNAAPPTQDDATPAAAPETQAPPVAARAEAASTVIATLIGRSGNPAAPPPRAASAGSAGVTLEAPPMDIAEGEASTHLVNASGHTAKAGAPPPTTTPQPLQVQGQAAPPQPTPSAVSTDMTALPANSAVGEAHAAAGSTTPAAGAPPPTLPAAVQVAAAIAKRFDARGTALEIRLDPPELGKVEIKLSVARDGGTIADITAEHRHTLGDLMRAARDLERALTDAGLSLEENGLSFNLSPQHQQGRDEQRATADYSASERRAATLEEDIAPLRAAPLYLSRWSGARLDIVT